MVAPHPPSLRPIEALRVDMDVLRRRGVFQHRVEALLDASWIADVLAPTDAEVSEAGRVEIELALPSEGAVIATGRLEVRFSVPCARCLEPATVAGSSEIQATFVVGDLPAPRGPHGGQDEEDEPGLGLSEDDLDMWTYDGHELELHEMVAEQIRLAYPMRAFCARGEECRGLCSNCGTNLNTATGEACPGCGAVRGADGPEAEGGALAGALKKLQFPD